MFGFYVTPVKDGERLETVFVKSREEAETKAEELRKQADKVIITPTVFGK